MDRKFQSKTYLSTRQMSELQRELQNDIPNVELRDCSNHTTKIHPSPCRGKIFSSHPPGKSLETLQALLGIISVLI